MNAVVKQGSFAVLSRVLFIVVVCLSFSGCFSARLNPDYTGPSVRPPELDKYYSRGKSYTSFTEELIRHDEKYDLKKIHIQSAEGEIVVDYYQRHRSDPNLVFVFPLLGGKNIVADYFAQYFVEYDFDTAIVNRNNDFKDPANFDRLEELLRKAVVRDRIAMDFFGKEYAKTEFGSFGISRGGINVAITAGVDPRLKHNVIAMGGTDLPLIFRNSHQKRIRTYAQKIIAQKNWSEDQFYTYLENTIKTDPKYTAKYMDARQTLMFISLFDQTVPFKNGQMLRQQIGDPHTIYLWADHYSSLLFTQIVELVPPRSSLAIFPLDYIETESLEFYRKSFGHYKRKIGVIPYALLQLPFNIIADMFNNLFWHKNRAKSPTAPETPVISAD